MNLSDVEKLIILMYPKLAFKSNLSFPAPTWILKIQLLLSKFFTQVRFEDEAFQRC